MEIVIPWPIQLVESVFRHYFPMAISVWSSEQDDFDSGYLEGEGKILRLSLCPFECGQSASVQFQKDGSYSRLPILEPRDSSEMERFSYEISAACLVFGVVGVHAHALRRSSKGVIRAFPSIAKEQVLDNWGMLDSGVHEQVRVVYELLEEQIPRHLQ